ncbi:hypothetical protein DL98DRAFT_590013 [Cadophora sp. DSE1049]|nr:hypothetical protein DL98DRAFT_590013 [Cadophora sp. DSE1049]
MSFGFGVGDFLAVGKLSIHLWRSIKDAPGEFAEVSRELSSINIVIADLTDQAGSQISLLNRRGASRKEELFTLRDNLMGTLEEPQAVHQKYRNMGRNAWLRVQLGEQDLAALRTRLSLHLGLIDSFMSSLTMASVGRMEPIMIEVLKILRNVARGHGGGPSTLLGTQVPDAGDDGWGAVERELQSEGIPADFVRSHMDDIKTLVDGVIADEAPGSLDDIAPDDSASQVETKTDKQSASASRKERSPAGKNSLDARRIANPRSESRINQKLNQLLGETTKEEIHAAKIRVMNRGYDMDFISHRPREALPPPPSPPLPQPGSFKEKIWGTSATRTYKKVLKAHEAFEADAAIQESERQKYGERSLCDAASRCDNIAVLLILQQGLDINTPSLPAQQETPIQRAISGNESDFATVTMVELLVELGGNVHTETFRSANLINTALLGKEITALFLLDLGVRIDEEMRYGNSQGASTEDKFSALHAAAGALHAPIVKLLLERGARVNALSFRKDPKSNSYNYRTPLDHCYKSKGQGTETERLLRAAGGVTGGHIHRNRN